MTAETGSGYVPAVLAMNINLPDPPRRANQRDRAFARQLEVAGVRLSLVEPALLPASLRRLIRPEGASPLSPIRSLAHFQPVIAELQEPRLPDGYAEYLRAKLRRVSPLIPAPAGVQNSICTTRRAN